jgi:hypothetical protein
MCITRCVVVLAVAVSAGASLAHAQKTSHYTFVVGSGFLCDSSDSSACPATVKATRGDSYEVSGAGTFDPEGKAVKGAGTFTHKSANGRVLETGVWTAEDLIGFVSYGTAPSALFRTRNSFGPMQSDPRRMKIRVSYDPMPSGGLALFRIQLLPISGAPKTAVLEVNCALGEVPPERSVEGIRVMLDKNDTEFSEESGGRVMFLSMRGLAAPAKAAQQEPEPGNAEIPHN